MKISKTYKTLAAALACVLMLSGCFAHPEGGGTDATDALPESPGESYTGSPATPSDTAETGPAESSVFLTDSPADGRTGTEGTGAVDTGVQITDPQTTASATTAAATTTVAVTTAAATTAAATTVPVTTAPVTTAPVTTAPVTTVPHTTAAPVTTSPPVTTLPATTAAPPVTTAPETTAEIPGTDPADPPDTSAPFFLSFTRNVTLKVGSTFNIHKYISYIDDLDPDVILTITEGSVDTNTVGTYNLSYRISDHSGNYTTATMKVEIVEKVTSSGSTTTPLPSKSFATFIETYKNENTMVGIDVSRYQGKIDFEKVAAAGCEFVIIKIGGYASGLFTDACYVENLKNAKAAGLKIGIYWYSAENGAAAVREHASYLYDLLDGEHLDFPIFFDWENYINFENYKMSLRDYNNMVLAFKDEAEKHGYRGALYGSKYYLNLLFNDEVKKGGVWLAHYTTETTYTGEYFLWQQGLARIDGIEGDVDVDVFYPDRLK